MAFNKYFEETKFQIDFNRYTAVSVNNTFNVLGEMRPDMVQIVIQDESKETYKLRIKSHKDVIGGIQYACLINSFDCEKEIKLTYFVTQHIWCIEK